MLGKTISHYRILEKLGRGGMGEVYLAEDTRLGRKVAIKVLTEDLAAERTALIRFRNEARAAAELSHPNIATIYDIGEADGTSFLVLEYLQGRTLRDQLLQGPLPIDEVVRVGKALAAGLAEAHTHGIVHRDIKSANIMLTEKGAVKILDFGLAFRIDTTQMTKPGTTLGTVAYMSPEQVRGARADTRSDIWSLGVVLYECVTGKLPFAGDGSAVFDQIQSQDVRPPTAVRTGVPMELEHTILRCLEKDPDHRFQHAEDLLAGLRALDSRMSSESAQSTWSRPPHRRRRTLPLRWFSAAAVVLLAGVILWQRPWQGMGGETTESSEPPRFGTPKVVPFLSTSALENRPAWSPTGPLVAHSSQADGDWDIWLSDLDASNPINLTAGHDGVDSYPTWSPDGQAIAFYSTRDGPGVYRMTVTGGNVRLLFPIDPSAANQGMFRLQWYAPDRILYSEKNSGTRVDVYDRQISTGEKRCLTADDEIGGYPGSMDPTGTRLAYREPILGANVGIKVMDLEAQETHLMPLKGQSAYWANDGSGLFVISSVDGSDDLWFQPVDPETGAGLENPRRLTSALELADFSESPDGRRAIAMQFTQTTNLWSLPTDRGPLESKDDLEQLTDDDFGRSWAVWLDSGGRYIEVSDRRGEMNPWIVDPEDQQRTRIREEKIMCPFPSPNGKWLVATPLDEANQLAFPFIMRPDGGGYRELHPPLRDQFKFVLALAWSRSGDRIAIHGIIEGEWKVGYLRVDQDSGTVLDSKVLPIPGSIPFPSPDGRFMVFQRTEEGESDLYVTNLAGDDVYRLTDSIGMEWVSGWEADPSRIYYKLEGAVYRIAMDESGRPTSEPELWAPASLRVLQFLNFANGRAIGPITHIDNDLWLIEFADGSE